MSMILAVEIALSIFLAGAISGALRDSRQFTRYEKATERYERAKELFYAWRKARPFLFVGQSPYAQSLVLEFIEQYQLAREFLPCLKVDEEVLASWRRLLNQMPPEYDPPASARFCGPFLFHTFCYSVDYALGVLFLCHNGIIHSKKYEILVSSRTLMRARLPRPNGCCITPAPNTR